MLAALAFGLIAGTVALCHWLGVFPGIVVAIVLFGATALVASAGARRGS
jgi:hypothetical protein